MRHSWFTQVGDPPPAERTGAWEVIGRPYTRGQRQVRARTRPEGRPDVTAIRTWGAHEGVAVRRG